MQKLSSRFLQIILIASFINCFAYADMFKGKCYEINDPNEKLNRAFSTINITLYKTLIYPPLKVYSAVVPSWGQDRINSLFDHLKLPLTLLNNLLQLDFQAASETMGRFVTNTTLGVGGLFDFASKFGVQKRPQTFESTLMHYGMPYGYYSVTPLLGPSTGRGTLGTIADFFTEPISWIIYFSVGHTESLYYTLFTNLNILMRYNDVINEYTASSVDPYIKIRNAYIQYLASKDPNCKKAQSINYSLDD